jgi:PilZ domain
MKLVDRRSEHRVGFERGIRVYIMAIDGTWRRECTMVDVSQNGARLCIEGPIDGLDLKEFFLLLSSTGLAFRRCRTVRTAGEQVRVEFLTPEKIAGKTKKKPYRQSTAKRI